MFQTIDKNLSTTFLACFGANFFLCFGLIISQRLYIDDISRSIDGNFNWSVVGRPLADIIFYVLNLGKPAINISPLNQIIALALISFACIVLARLIGGVDNPAAVALCTLSFGGQTYYLENLSYGFDSLTMTSGLLCSVLAGAIVLRKSGKREFLLSSLMLLAVLCLYQPATTVYFIIFLFVFLRDVQIYDWDFRSHFMRLMRCGGVFATASITYSWVILPTLNQNAYSREHSTILALHDLPDGIARHVEIYWTILYQDWRGSALGICALLVIAMAIILIGLAGKFSIGNNFQKIAFSFATVVILGFVVILSYGLPLALEKPVWAPRTFVGIGAVLSLCSLQIFALTQWGSELRKEQVAAFVLRAPVVVLGYALIVAAYAFSYANAAQKDFEISFISRLLYDIDSVYSKTKINEITFLGGIPASPVLVNTARKFPLIDRLVPRHITGNWWWGHMQLRAYGLPVKYSALDPVIKEQIETGVLHPLREGQYYKLYLEHDQLVVRFL